MKKGCKYLVLFGAFLMLTGCTLPFQSKEYPTWKTKGILESYTLADGRNIGGWLGAYIKDKISCKWYDFTVNLFEEVNEYDGYKASDGKKLYHANITITNTSDKDVYLFEDDFALVWNLGTDNISYQSSKQGLTDTMLVNEMVIKIGETKNIDTLYEVDKSVKKPMAIYYYEQYSDNQKGNKYYVYL